MIIVPIILVAVFAFLGFAAYSSYWAARGPDEFKNLTWIPSKFRIVKVGTGPDDYGLEARRCGLWVDAYGGLSRISRIDSKENLRRDLEDYLKICLQERQRRQDVEYFTVNKEDFTFTSEVVPQKKDVARAVKSANILV